MRGRGVVFLFLSALLFFPVQEGRAAGPAQVVAMGQATGRITVDAGKSVIVKSSTPVTRVSISSDGVADYLLLSPNQIYVTGKKPGVANLTLWKGEDAVSAV
ncbi:MAG: pilus assembly protein N-terminal domain-containing protein, partial [Syntrophaceae bacterium]